MSNIVSVVKRQGLSRQALTVSGLLLMVGFYIGSAIATSHVLAGYSFNRYLEIMPILTLWFSALSILLFESGRGELSPAIAGIIWKTEIFGALTYCIYMVHEPIYILFRRTLPSIVTWQGSLTLFPLVNGIVLLAAYALYRGIEKRFDSYRHGHQAVQEVALGIVPP